MDDEKQRKIELRLLFLALWDKAVGTADYDKQQWMEFESLLDINSMRPTKKTDLA